jgi:hypothetical protein
MGYSFLTVSAQGLGATDAGAAAAPELPEELSSYNNII